MEVAGSEDQRNFNKSGGQKDILNQLIVSPEVKTNLFGTK